MYLATHVDCFRTKALQNLDVNPVNRQPRHLQKLESAVQRAGPELFFCLCSWSKLRAIGRLVVCLFVEMGQCLRSRQNYEARSQFLERLHWRIANCRPLEKTELQKATIRRETRRRRRRQPRSTPQTQPWFGVVSDIDAASSPRWCCRLTWLILSGAVVTETLTVPDPNRDG